MTDENYRELKVEIKRIADTMDELEVGLSGIPKHNVLGSQQKIQLVREDLETAKKEILELKGRVDKIYWTAIGVSTTSGAFVSIIFYLIQLLLK